MKKAIPKQKPDKPKPMEDYEVKVFLIDHYGVETRSASKLLQLIREKHGRSCSMERFRTIFNEHVRKYAPQDLLKA